MLTVIIVVHLLIVLGMIGVVLLQRSEGGGLGIGSSGGFMTNRGTANVLTRATAVLAAVFFATSLLMSVIASWDRKPKSILQGAGAPSAPSVPGSAPVPFGQPGGGVLDALRGAPQQPAAPQAPQSK
jgi:preprotein translocase subunit SecG